MSNQTLLIVSTPSHLIKYDFENIKSANKSKIIVLTSSKYKGKLPPDIVQKVDDCFYLDYLVRDGLSHIEISAIPKPLYRELEAAASARLLRIVTTVDEYARFCGALRTEFGTPGRRIEDVDAIADKAKAKSKVSARGLRVPKGRTYRVEELTSLRRGFAALTGEFGPSIIIKPLGASGCVGVSHIRSESEFDAWLKSPKVSDMFEVEEFFDGDLYHFDAFVLKGSIVGTYVWKYCNPMLKFLSGLPTGSISLPRTDETFQQINAFGTEALHALGLSDGSIHMEVFRNKSGELCYLEAGPRTPGITQHHVYLRTYGINYVDVDLQIALGQCPDLPQDELTHGFWMIWPQKPGLVQGYAYPANDVELHMSGEMLPGETAVQPTSIKYKSCQIDGFHRDFRVLNDAFRRISAGANPLKVA